MHRSHSSPSKTAAGFSSKTRGNIPECLDAVRRRWRRLRLAEGAGLLVAAAGSAVVTLFLLDNVFHVAPPGRLALLCGGLLVVGAVAVRFLLLRPLREPGDVECALLVEKGQENLENRLINTVLFRRRKLAGTERAVVEYIHEETAARLADLPWNRILDRRKALRYGTWAAVALLLVGLYAVLLPAHFRNAAERFVRPLSDVAPLTLTRLKVRPGDTELRLGDAFTVEAETEGVLPEKALFLTSTGAEVLMKFNGRFFEHTVDDVTAGFTYRVAAGDARSPGFEVKVIRPPEVKSLDLTIHRPAYTGLPPRVEKGSSGNLDILEGSRVALSVQATRPLESAKLLTGESEFVDMKRADGDRFEVTFDLTKDLEYEILLVDAEGAANPETGLRRKLKAVGDAAPLCEIVDPGRDVDASPETGRSLPVTIRVADDIGLAAAWLAAAPLEDAAAAAPAEAAWKTAASKTIEKWEGIRSEKEAVLSSALRFSSFIGKSGRPPPAVLYRAIASDLKGSRSMSRTFKVRLLDRKASLARAGGAAERLQSDLAEVLRREKALEKQTSGMLQPPAGSRSSPATRQAISAAAREQYDIRSLLLAVIADSRKAATGLLDPASTRQVRRGLREAAADLMPDVALLLMSASGSEEEARRNFLREARSGEERIIELLSRFLEELGTLARAVRSGETEAHLRAASQASLRGVNGKLRDLLAKLQEFNREQKEVVSRTEALEDKTPEDFTEAELEALDELAAQEEAWGKLLEEAGTDLSKVTPQDMSLGTLAEEVVELVEEIDLAKEYLEGKNIELAVPAEQSGVALSEEIETNIERWLLRDRDRLKWVMEQPTGEFDVPLADLPSELEDIVGELIDREELMTPETEDVTSSWLDSMDDAVGWDAMDGPISNMSAKGVTGNLQPNDMEIGGRSGEGRSGKSQGQFVEETATGKGGRQTPSRSTPDPFESGEVKDTGKDPAGGSTGGGKLSGAGPQGLRGPPSPEIDRKLGAIARRQVEIRQQAEQLDLALRRRRYYAQDLERALQLMRAMETGLAAKRRANYETLRRRIVSELRNLDRAVASRIDVQLARNPPPVASQQDLLDASGEEAPEEHRSLIRSYYRSLSRSPTGAQRAAGTQKESP